MGLCFLGQHEWVDNKSGGFFKGGSVHCRKCFVSEAQWLDPTSSLVWYTSLKLRQMALGYCPCCKGVIHADSCYLKELERQYDEYMERQMELYSSIRGD